MSINWSQILGTLISEVIKVLMPWTKTALEELLEWAYESVENWASKQKDKPDPTAKMSKAVTLVQVFEPALGGAEIRCLMEAEHLKKKEAA